MPGLAAFAALVSLAGADISLVETLPVTYRLGAAVAAIPFLCLSIAMLRRRLMLRAFPGGVEVGRLGRPVRRLPWQKIGGAVVHTGPWGRRVVLWSADRRRRVGEVREQHSGSLEAVVAQLRYAGVETQIKIGRLTRLHHLAALLLWTGKLVGVGLAVIAVLVLPVPSRYANLPGDVESATAALTLPVGHPRPPAGDVAVVSTRAGPANLLTMLLAREEPAIDVASHSAIFGSTPQAISAEADHQLTSTAATEAVAAAWRWMGFPVSVDGAGVELLTVPASLRTQLHPEDVVEALDSRPTPTLWDFWSAVGDTRGQSVRLAVRRGARRFEVLAPPKWCDSGPGGLFVAPAEVQLLGAPFRIDIDHSGLTGNSAGLAWGLAVVQRVGAF